MTKIKFSKWFFKPNTCEHGPQEWPWWKLISFYIVKKYVKMPSTGYALWIYTRWWALELECYFDRIII